MKRGFRGKSAVGITLALLLCASSLPAAHAQTEQGDFSLQVSPSPLVTTVKPGEVSKADFKIRNASTTTEELKIEPRAFTFNDTTGQVSLQDTTPPDIGQWITFSNPTPTILPGQTVTEQMVISLPKDSGFSYSFALVISRKNNPAPIEGSRLIKGSLAIFSLVNVDRPGASSKLEVLSLKTDKRVYEYLPSKITVQLKNSGNTIVQPYGNIFIQRGASSTSPLATLKVNDTKSYILPGTQRSLSSEWTAGFPAYTTTTKDDGSTNRSLQFNWDRLSEFRIGRYTAKLVAVYNDGQRDVPIEGEVSFWVIPWRSILILIGAIIVLWSFFRWRGKKRTAKAVQKALENAKKVEDKKDSDHA